MKSISPRVLVLHNFYRNKYPSGENLVVNSEVDLLKNANIPTKELFAYSDNIPYKSSVNKLKTGYHDFVWSEYLNKFEQITTEFKPNILHFHNLSPNFSPRIIKLAHSKGIKVIQTMHNYRRTCINGLHWLQNENCFRCLDSRWKLPGITHKCFQDSLFRSSAKVANEILFRNEWLKIDHLIVLTPYMYEHAIKYGYKAENISMRPTWSTEIGFSEIHNTDVLFAGRLESAKGLEILLNAWESKRTNDSKLYIAGSGPLAELVREKSSENPTIDFLGLKQKDEITKLITSVGIIAVPSVWVEGFPLSIVEAFSAGKPVIINNRTSHASALNSDVSWITEPTVENWTKTFDSINLEELTIKGKNAYSLYKSNMTPNAALKSILNIYHQVLQN